MDMDPEEKKRKLEELRKELNPEILSKMADYLGGSGEGGTMGSSDFHSSSAADVIRDKQAARFQERVARRKQENMESAAAESQIKEVKPVTVFCRNEFWSRILETQLKNLGFFQPVTFSDFGDLIRFLSTPPKEDREEPCAVIIPFQEAGYFLPLWTSLRLKDIEKKILPCLHVLPVFVIAENEKQVPEEVINQIGAERVISLTDHVNSNLEKIARAVFIK